MKKIYMIPLIASLCVFLSVQAFADVQEILRAEKSNSQIYINGEKKDFKNAPVTINGTAYVPLREMGENMNTDVTWKNSEKKISLCTVPMKKRIDTFFPLLDIPQNDKITVKNIDYEYSYDNTIPAEFSHFYTEVTVTLEVDKDYAKSDTIFQGGKTVAELGADGVMNLIKKQICDANNLDFSKAEISAYYKTMTSTIIVNGKKNELTGPYFPIFVIGGKELKNNKISVIVQCEIPDKVTFDN